MPRRSLAASWSPGGPVANALAVAALCGPFVLAFFSGGYFPEARNWAGAICWGLLGLSLLLPGGRWPRGRPAFVTFAGLAVLAAWTAASMLWAPSVDTAYGYVQLAVLYLGALLLCAHRLCGAAGRAVEPVLALGCAGVVAYGISERLVPGLLHFVRSVSAEGRLDQPLTYWNAMGELAAIGFVLAARVAGDARRGAIVRAAAAGVAPVLGLGIYLSFSRGALFAAAAGTLSLVILSPTRGQLRVVVIVVVAAAAVSGLSAPLSGVTALTGSLGTRETQGLLLFLGIAIFSAAAVVVSLRTGGRGADLDRPLRLVPYAGWLTLAIVTGMLAIAIVAGAKEGSARHLSGGVSRLETLQSNRYAYWKVALDAFGGHPLQGVGAGGWATEWLRKRHVNEYATDAHSLPLQTMAELGLVGLAFLILFLGGVTSSARSALLRDRTATAGLVAGFVTWAAHQPLDWDWEMPALTLLAMVLAGATLAHADSPAAPDRSGSDGRVEAPQ